MGGAKEQWMEMQEATENKRLAALLGLTYEELEELTWGVEADYSDDGLLYGYRVEFDEGGNKAILGKIKGLEDGRTVYLSQWELETDSEYAELEWDIFSSNQLKVLKAQLESVENILNLAVDRRDEFSLLVMLHAHIIASLEQYMSSTFIHHVTNSEPLMKKLVETDPEFAERKFTLNEIYVRQKELKVIVADYLKLMIFHKLEKVKPMYENVFDFDFGDIKWLFRAIKLRHDCVHRAGVSKDGKEIIVTSAGVKDLAEKCRLLATQIDLHISEM